MKWYFENECPSPDGSGNPFEKNSYFFLVQAKRPEEAIART